jgi:hypothetical protein
MVEFQRALLTAAAAPTCLASSCGVTLSPVYSTERPCCETEVFCALHRGGVSV